MEELLIECTEARCNVDLLCDPGDDDMYNVGVRLRPWANKTSRSVMIMAEGDTVREALENAVQKARSGRWEPLDWAKRPWTTRPRLTGSWK